MVGGSEGREKEMGQRWWSLRESRTLVDVELAGAALPPHLPGESAHSALLAAHSPFFRRALAPPIARLQLPAIPHDALRPLLRFLYTRALPKDAEPRLLLSLLLAADFLLLPELARRCLDAIRARLSASCWRSFLEAGETLPSLGRLLEDFLLRQFASVAGQREWSEVSLERAVWVLGSRELDVVSELEVAEGAVSWLRAESGRTALAGKLLLGQVRRGLLGVGEVSRFRELATSVGVEEWVDSGSEVSEKWEMSEPRLPGRLMLAVGGWSVSHATGVVESFDPRGKSWCETRQGGWETEARAYHGLAQLGSELVMAGGMDGRRQLQSVRALNLESGEWRELAPMHRRRCYVSMAEMEGRLWALGGYNGSSRHRSAEVYRREENQWEYLPPMRWVRSDATATTMGEEVWVCGGFDGLGVLRSCEWLDAGSGRWVEGPELDCPRSGLSSTRAEGSLFVVGGFDGSERLRSGVRLDPREGRWSPLPPMPTQRSNLALCLLEGSLVALGGYDATTTVSVVQALDLRNLLWRSLPNMRVPRSALKAIVLPYGPLQILHGPQWLHPGRFPPTLSHSAPS